MFIYFQVCNLGGIQKLCDVLQENPMWTVAHLAAYFSLYDTFQHPLIIRYLTGYEVRDKNFIMKIHVNYKYIN
jgi:hypothetical protein